jgi:hypothetical protein
MERAFVTRSATLCTAYSKDSLLERTSDEFEIDDNVVVAEQALNTLEYQLIDASTVSPTFRNGK